MKVVPATIRMLRMHPELYVKAWEEVTKGSLCEKASSLEVDWDGMEAMQNNGMLVTYFLMDRDEVVGYWILAITPSFFVLGKEDVTSVSLYIKFRYRPYFSEFIKEVEKDLKLFRIRNIAISVKKPSKVLEEEGYLDKEYWYYKEL